MNRRRVAITGVGVTSPLGHSLEELIENLAEGKSSIQRMPDWDARDLKTKLASVVSNFDKNLIPRNIRRSMSRVSQLAYDATKKCIDDSHLTQELVQNDRTGVFYGSTMGGTDAIERYYAALAGDGSSDGLYSSTFLQIMSHTCASNLIVAFQIPGRAVASCVACSASTQSIGFAYEAISYGKLDRAICGGAEEMHLSIPLVFESLYATSTKYNEEPHKAPKPFDKNRDGLVVGEGAGTLLLEDFEMAVARKAKIYGEIVGFHTNADGSHMTNPSRLGMQKVMNGALEDANLQPSAVDYVNAHATATLVGDIAESHAIEMVFSKAVPVSSFKGHFGHLMGACGAVEIIGCLGMFQKNILIPTLNLDQADPQCADLNYITSVRNNSKVDIILKNSFAFGGINSCLVLKRA